MVAEQTGDMRVLHVIPSVAPVYGGPSQAVIDMCRALTPCGVEPLVATTDADGHGRLSVEYGRIVSYRGAPTIFFPRQLTESFKYSRPLARWLAVHVPEFGAVHIHAVFSHACITAANACRRNGVPYIIRPLGTLDPWSMRQKSLRKRVLWHLGAKQALGGASAIHYTTAEEKRLAETSLGLRSGVVIPLGISREFVAEPGAAEQFRDRHPTLGQHPYVLILCRLHPKKGLEPFLKVFLALTTDAEFTGWRLVVAGDGDPSYVAGLKRTVQEQNGDQRVLFTGWLGGEDKRAALRGAALMALPSHQENFGLSIVEALASGVPALVSPYVNLAGEIEAAGAGWVVDLEPAALREGLRRAMHDPDNRARRGAAGRELAVSRFTWPPIANQLAELYAAIERRP